jgi:ABC-type transporter lipoprotein component MlaA
MLQLFRQNLLEVVKAIAPLIVVICALQLTFVKAPASLFLRFLIGSLMALGGLVLFFTGIDI